MWSFSQVVRLGTIDVPKADLGSREHSASAMALLLFLSGMILGVFSGMLLGLVVLPRWQRRQQRQHEIDRRRALDHCGAYALWRGSFGAPRLRKEPEPKALVGTSHKVILCLFGSRTIGGREAAWVRRMTGRWWRAYALHQKFCAAALAVDVCDAHGGCVSLLPVWFYLA